MTDRQLNPEQEVEIAEEWTRKVGTPSDPSAAPDVRETPAEPAEPNPTQDESTEFDRHREAGASQ